MILNELLKLFDPNKQDEVILSIEEDEEDDEDEEKSFRDTQIRIYEVI